MCEQHFIEASGLPKIESAGGLVVNSSGFILFILKGGKWDLPKGRVESESEYEETALREVVEETSIESHMITIVSPLCHTWHLTSYRARQYIKKTTWFIMEYGGDGENLRPQFEEGITECRWIHPGSFKTYSGGMRPRIEYVATLWKKVFFERGMHKFLIGAPRAAG